jgi:hypothetical protein
MPEQCSSCKLPILSISEQTRVPFFKADSDAAKKLLTYIKKPMHRECWKKWEHMDLVASLAVRWEARRGTGQDRKLILVTQHSVAWGQESEQIAFSHGTLCLPRSTMIVKLMYGDDGDSCTISSRLANILYLVNMIRNGRMVPGKSETRPAVGALPDLHVSCGTPDQGFLPVILSSGGLKYGLDQRVFLNYEDLAEIGNFSEKQLA